MYFRAPDDYDTPYSWELVVSDLDGSNLVVLDADLEIHFFFHDDARAVWSPDDAQILYSATVATASGAVPKIFLINADGTNRVVVRERAGGADWR